MAKIKKRPVLALTTERILTETIAEQLMALASSATAFVEVWLIALGRGFTHECVQVHWHKVQGWNLEGQTFLGNESSLVIALASCVPCPSTKYMKSNATNAENDRSGGLPS